MGSRDRIASLLHVAALAASFGIAGCALGGPPHGMTRTTPRVHDADTSLLELSRAVPREGERALLVVYPRDACSGSASGIVVDERGHFLGAVAPGTAALLRIPEATRRVAVFSSVELGTFDRAQAFVDEVELDVAPSGLLLTTSRPGSLRPGTRHCGTGQYIDATVATKAELETELGEHDIVWLEPDVRAGQAWLDEHRARVDHVLGLEPNDAPPPSRTRLVVR